MIILAIEQSTEIASVALVNGSGLLAERTWLSLPRERSLLFDAVPSLLSDCRLCFSEISDYAVGLGPGSYSGLRAALSAAAAFALPGKNELYGMSSARVLASNVMEETHANSVLVIGNARREQLWLSHIEADSRNEVRERRLLLRPDELHAHCPPDSLCVSPAFDEIGQMLEELLPSSVQLIREKRVPSAFALGRLAIAGMRLGEPSEPLAPIYLHPAVRRLDRD